MNIPLKVKYELQSGYQTINHRRMQQIYIHIIWDKDKISFLSYTTNQQVAFNKISFK